MQSVLNRYSNATRKAVLCALNKGTQPKWWKAAVWNNKQKN